jgi:AcrR family transcriptional regulator
LVIYYFQTKDNLLTEAVRLAEDLWYDFGYKRLETATDAIGRISVVIDTMFVPPAQLGFPPLGALWVELWGRSLRHPDVARVREEFDSQWRQVIAGVVVQGQASGEFGPADPDQFAIALSALLDGLSVQLALEDPAVSPATAFRIAMGYASGQLGFAWGPGDHPPVPVGAPVVTA